MPAWPPPPGRGGAGTAVRTGRRTRAGRARPLPRIRPSRPRSERARLYGRAAAPRRVDPALWPGGAARWAGCRTGPGGRAQSLRRAAARAAAGRRATPGRGLRRDGGMGYVLAVIVVAGESLIDLVPQHPEIRWGRWRQPGRRPVQHGRRPRAARCAGGLLLPRSPRTPSARRCSTGLAAAGVDTSLVQRGPEPTTLAVATLDAGRLRGLRLLRGRHRRPALRATPQLPAAGTRVGARHLLPGPGAGRDRVRGPAAQRGRAGRPHRCSTPTSARA